MNLEKIANQVRKCEYCALRYEATQPVTGIGAEDAKYFIIGEAPGRDEDRCGIPFVGAAGKRLDRLIRLAKIDPNDCYITNVCKCRPPKNRPPKKSERLTCFQWLALELDELKPKIVITLGATPLSFFTEQGITQMHGTMFHYKEDGMGREFDIIAHYHPAAALHKPSLWAVMLNDWEFIPQKAEASFQLVPRISLSSDFALDTENDPNGTIGTWSMATREEGKLVVSSHDGQFGPNLSQAQGTCVMHNAKWDLRILKGNKMSVPKKYADTMIAAYCLGNGRQDTRDGDKSGDKMVGGLGLKYLARRHLGMEMKSWQEVYNKPNEIEEYNAKDSVATYLLWEKWKPQLPEHFWTIDMPLLEVCMAMEDRGVMVDPAFLKKYAERLEESLKQLELNGINPYSPAQVSGYVYDTLGIPPTKFTPSGKASTDSSVLETIDDPVVRNILQYREFFKEKSTYVSNYAKLLDPSNRIHCEFKQTSTATGRLSSARPNLQNVTTSYKSDLRTLFVAPEGKMLIDLDYIKLEFGVQAAITQDPIMLEAFLHGNIHQETADALGVSYDDGKRINFLLQNGGDAWKISMDFGVPFDVARQHIKNYYQRFPVIAEYHAQQKHIAHTEKRVVNYFGRVRRLDSMYSEHFKTIREGEKAAMATPIQGAAAEVVKLAMIALHYKHNAPMISQVHDELIFEVPEKEAKEYAHWLKKYVPTITEINGIYFPVSVGVGKNWKEAKENEL